MHVTSPFGLVFPASYDEYTALVKSGTVASKHVRSSQWNVSLVKPGYRDLVNYVVLSARVNWCSLRKRRDIFEQCCDQLVV